VNFSDLPDIDQKEMEDMFMIFCNEMLQGLAIGAKEYGHTGFLKNDVIHMMEEEARDLACYGFMFWVKIRMMRKRLMRLKDMPEVNPERAPSAEGTE